MTGATYSDVESYGMLQEIYSDDTTVQEQIQHSFYNFCRKAGSGEVNMDGNGFNTPAQYALNESYGAKNDGERLPDPQFIKGVYAKYKPKLSYSSIEMTSFAATRGHKGGRPNGKYIEDTLKSTLLAFMSNLDSDALGNGRGYRATILAATAAQSSFTVNFSTRLRPNMVLDWYDSTYATKRGTIKISDRGVDRMNRTVYIDSSAFTGEVPASATSGDVLVVQNSLAAGEPSDGRHCGGFARMADSSVSLGTLSPSTYAWWSPTNINAGLANPNEMILQQHTDAIFIISGAYPNRLAINPAWKRGWMSSLLSQRQFTSNVYNTGMSSLSFQPVKVGKDASGKKPVQFEILEDKNMDPTQYFLWVYEAFCIATDYSTEPHLADEDGAEFRYRHNYDSMHGFMRFWWNLVSKQRSGLGRGYNFSTASGII